MTAVTVTVGYSDSFGNPRFITNKPPLLTVTKKSVTVTLLPIPEGVTVTADHYTEFLDGEKLSTKHSSGRK